MRIAKKSRVSAKIVTPVVFSNQSPSTAALVDPTDKDLETRLAGHRSRRAALTEEIKVLERRCGNKHGRIDSEPLQHLPLVFRRNSPIPTFPRSEKITCSRSSARL